MKSGYQRIITRLLRFGRSKHWWIAGGMLAVMFGLGVTSMAGDSAIIDEVAHIPAGYSYLHYADFRLNPEHPPLIKDLSGLPLQFMDVTFPDLLPAWTSDVNGQWDTGWHFLYHFGNDADTILFWSRLPILLLAIGFGVVLYRFVQRRWGWQAALLVLFFYALSPNIIAHARYVTTDLGASVFIFLALIAFVRFIEHPTRSNVFILSLALAAANLAKFNAALLYPLLGLATLAAVAFWERPMNWRFRLKNYLGGFMAACVGSVAWIWAYYVPHTLNMPGAVQDKLIAGSLTLPNVVGFGQFLQWLNDLPLMQPLAQYLLGLGMVYTRIDNGNVTYFNGQVTNTSFHLYFPQLFMVKTQVAFLILGLIALGVLASLLFSRRPRVIAHKLLYSARHHLLEWTIGVFALLYFGIAVAGNLNLGIRHILPIYIPLFVLVALAVVEFLRRLASTKYYLASLSGLAVLLVWYAGSTLWVHPSYTAYFNELMGGPANAHRYFSDSSVDWGQDLRRLKTYVDRHPEIGKIAVDYFGGGEPKYYFCDRKLDDAGRIIPSVEGYDCSGSVYQEWHADMGTYEGQYIAVSETFLQNDIYFAAKDGYPGYQYLRDQTPVAKVGYSIYVYKLY